MVQARPTVRRILGLGSLIALAAAGTVAFGAVPASAAGQTRYVATGGDDADNDCTDQNHPCATIQYAVNVADSGDTLSVAGGTYDESVRIRKSLTIVGAGSTGAAKTTVDGEEENGPSFFIDANDTNVLPVVTLQAMDISGNQDDDGVLLNFSATAHIIDCTIADNASDGVEADQVSVVTIDGSTLAGNQDSGVLLEGGNATITNSTLDKNVGGGVVVNDNESTATVRTSTVSNTVPFDEERFDPFGAGVIVFGGTASIDTSTIVGNTGQGVLSLSGHVTVDNSTVADTLEPADEGPVVGGPAENPYGGIAVANAPTLTTGARSARAHFTRNSASGATRKALKVAVDQAPSTTVTGTIVANNSPLADCNGPIVDGGYNLSSDGTCGFSAAKHDLNKTDPKLGPLADNGGPTKTELLLKHSPAIDAIASGKAGCVSDAADQRGIARPQPTGEKCDIGAVELKADAIVIHPNSLPHGTVGTAYHAKVTATGGAYPTYAFSLAPGSTLPDGLTISSGGVISGTPTKAGSFPFTVSVNDPVLKDYTIVIDAAAAPDDNDNSPIANTGTNVLPLSTAGGLAVLAGLVMLLAAGLVGRRPGRHRAN